MEDLPDKVKYCPSSYPYLPEEMEQETKVGRCLAEYPSKQTAEGKRCSCPRCEIL